MDLKKDRRGLQRHRIKTQRGLPVLTVPSSKVKRDLVDQGGLDLKIHVKTSADAERSRCNQLGLRNQPRPGNQLRRLDEPNLPSFFDAIKP